MANPSSTSVEQALQAFDVEQMPDDYQVLDTDRFLKALSQMCQLDVAQELFNRHAELTKALRAAGYKDIGAYIETTGADGVAEVVEAVEYLDELLDEVITRAGADLAGKAIAKAAGDFVRNLHQSQELAGPAWFLKKLSRTGQLDVAQELFKRHAELAEALKERGYLDIRGYIEATSSDVDPEVAEAVEYLDEVLDEVITNARADLAGKAIAKAADDFVPKLDQAQFMAGTSALVCHLLTVTRHAGCEIADADNLAVDAVDIDALYARDPVLVGNRIVQTRVLTPDDLRSFLRPAQGRAEALAQAMEAAGADTLGAYTELKAGVTRRYDEDEDNTTERHRND